MRRRFSYASVNSHEGGRAGSSEGSESSAGEPLENFGSVEGNHRVSWISEPTRALGSGSDASSFFSEGFERVLADLFLGFSFCSAEGSGPDVVEIVAESTRRDCKLLDGVLVGLRGSEKAEEEEKRDIE